MRKLIDDKIRELGLNYAEVSLKIGRNQTYLQQFLKRGTPAELKEGDRARLAELLGVPENELRGPSNPLPKRDYLKSAQPVAEGSRVANKSDSGHNSLDIPRSSAQLYVDRDLPVFGTAQGGRGELVLSHRAIDYIARPTPLLRVEEAYAMIVAGDLMSPKIENGDTVLVNPHLPWRIGDTCIFRRKTDNAVTLATLRRATTDSWLVRQIHPRRDFTLKRVDWHICHVIVGTHFAR